MISQTDGSSIILILLYFVVIVFYLYCMGKVYQKAQRSGWIVLVPFYNTLVSLEIIGRPWWWLLLMFIPIVDVVIGIVVLFELARVFGKGTGFGFGLWLLPFIFIPILALGDAVYQGPLIQS